MKDMARRWWWDVVYMVALVLATLSVLMLAAAFAQPSEHPFVGAFSLEHLVRTIIAAISLVGAAALLLLDPSKSRVLGLLRRMLASPVMGSATRYAMSLVALFVVGGAAQLPILLSTRVSIHACERAAHVCAGDVTTCTDELALVRPGETGWIRIFSGRRITIFNEDGAVVWQGHPEHDAYSAPDAPIQACLRVEFEFLCNSLQLTAHITNHTDHVYSFLGFALKPFYDEHYEKAAMRVDQVPSLAPLVIVFGTMAAENQREVQMLEVPSGEHGLATIPVEVTRPDPEINYVQASHICVRYRLRGEPACTLDDLLVVSIDNARTYCVTTTGAELAARVAAKLKALELPDSIDDLRILSRLRPVEAERELLETYARCGHDTKYIGTRLGVLDAFRFTRGKAARSLLEGVMSETAISASERLAALRALAEIDTSINEPDVLREWVKDGNADLASRAIEYLPFDSRVPPCAARLEQRRCDDLNLVMTCGALGAPELRQMIASWEAKCQTSSP